MTVLIGGKTHFSLGESILDPEDLVTQAKEAGYKAIAVADTMTINSLTTVFTKAKELEMKAIIGAGIRVVDNIAWRKGDSKRNPFFIVKLFVKNEAGLRDLFRLLTLAYGPDRFYNQAQVSLDDLCECIAKGNLVVTSGDAFSVYGHRNYREILECIFAALPDQTDFVSETIPVDTVYYQRLNEIVLHWELEQRPENFQIVLSRPTLNPKDEVSLRNTLSCIVKRDKVDSLWRQEPAADLHIMPFKEVVERFVTAMKIGGPRGGGKTLAMKILNATVEFSDRFDYTWEKMPLSLPKMADNPFETLTRLCKEGWKRRIATPTLGYQPPPEQLPAYRERLKYELSILRKMGFENYFLLVSYLVNWCKENDILVGPGRGSCGGSLVAYLLGITDVDPIRFGLIFERFINPDRLDLPDIDLDFMSSRREEVIDQLIAQFGIERVAGIANYGMLGSASSLRAVASAHNLTELDFRCSKQMPKEHGQPVDLEIAKEQVPDIDKFSTTFPEVWRQACGLQKVFRNYGRHAAGVIVAADPIIERAVVDTRDKYPMVNWDKRVVEDFGLVKLDVLGLQTLDLLHMVRQYVKEQTGEELDFTQLPLDDGEVLEAFGNGDTTAVFQFDGGGVRHLLKQLAFGDGLTFDDLVATTALFRPGPLDSGLTEAYVQIKQGARLPEYAHPCMEDALRGTYSIIIYQEQIQQIARDLAGFTMTEADHLRRAIGKKDAEKMKKMRESFVKGASTETYHVTLDNGQTATLTGGKKYQIEGGKFYSPKEIIEGELDLAFPIKSRLL